MRNDCWTRAGWLLAVCLTMLGSRAAAESSTDFTISIDRKAWSRWGLEYPVTYVFQVSEVSPRTAVMRRDTDSEAWRRLERKTARDFFNGVPCVRFARDKAYVSVGFGAAARIQLRFSGVGSVAFDKVAKYYDGRAAAMTLSNDNWGKRRSANPGAAWKGATDDASDKYQASIHACRRYRLPVSVGINSRMYGGADLWKRMQEELDRGDRSWEPVVHTRSHPCSAKAYRQAGYPREIVGCRDDILENLHGIPYGQHVFEFILPCAYRDDEVRRASAGEFLFLRDWNVHDNPASTAYVPWNPRYRYYGIGGAQTKSYDAVMEKRRPKGRYYAADVAELNRAFDAVYRQGGIFYAMWHSDRYASSVIHDPRPGIDGQAGSTLMQHFAHISGRRDVWYAANGWLYSYRFVAQRATVK